MSHEYEASPSNPLAMPFEPLRPNAVRCVECGEPLDEQERATESGCCHGCW